MRTCSCQEVIREYTVGTMSSSFDSYHAPPKWKLMIFDWSGKMIRLSDLSPFYPLTTTYLVVERWTGISVNDRKLIFGWEVEIWWWGGELIGGWREENWYLSEEWRADSWVRGGKLMWARCVKLVGVEGGEKFMRGWSCISPIAVSIRFICNLGRPWTNNWRYSVSTKTIYISRKI